MAVGDISAVLDTKSLDIDSAYPHGAHRGGNIFVCVHLSSLNELEILTQSVANDGTITSVDSWNTGVTIYTQYLVHITGSVFAVFYSDNPAQGGYCRTFQVDASGNITKSFDQTLQFASGSFPEDVWIRCEPVDTGNNIWLVATQASNDISIWSIYISDDGATITEKDKLQLAMTQNKGLAMRQANSTIYAVYSEQLVNAQKLFTFECDSSGNLTSKDSHTYATVAFGEPGMVLITGGVILISRTGGFETRAVASNGTIGAEVDDSAISEARYLYNLGLNTDEDYVIIYQSGDNVYTRAIASGGTIGSQVDTLDLSLVTVGRYHIVQGAEVSSDVDMWVTFQPADPTFNLYAVSYTVEGQPTYFDRIYVFLGDSAEDEVVELTDPDYSMVLSARTERGRDSELDQATSGIAELTVDNFAGDFNPENAGGQYYGQLALGKWITIFEVYLGVKYKHFTGKIDKITPNDDPTDLTAYILAVDGMDDLAGTEIKTVLRTTTETGELVGDVLDAANWPAGDRDLDTGVDILQVGWFHKVKALDSIRILEKTEDGRFYIDIDGDAIWENRHHRITGDGLVSQHDFEDTAVKIEYEYSKRLLYNEINVSGRRYYAGGVTLFSGYDMATLDAALIWSAHAGDVGAPYVPQGITLTLWADVNSPLASYTSLVKGTHWNANTAADKTGTDVSDNITLVQTAYGQAVKLAFTNNGGVGAYLVIPDSPPAGAPSARTCLVYGVLYGTEEMAITESNATSQADYGKRSLEVNAPFMSNPNDILAHAQYLLAKYENPVPRAISIQHSARTAWPDDTLRVQCLVRKISDRITVKSTKLAVDRDFYINKVIQEYIFQEGGMVHETTWVIERARGSAEGMFWLLGVPDFGELGVVTRLGR